MAQINGTVGKNGFGFYAIVTEAIPSDYLSTNATTVKYEVYIKNGNVRTNSSYWTFNAKIDGSNVYNKSDQKLITNDTDYNTAKLLFSGTKSVTHNNDGTKTITFSASLIKDTSKAAYTDYDPGACSLSGSFTLTTIPRYAAFTSHKVNSVSHSEVRISYETDVECVDPEYSLNNGPWTTPTVSEGGGYTISGLMSGTMYSVKTRVKHGQSGLPVVSNTLSVLINGTIVKVNVNGTWKKATPYLRMSGSWETAKAFVNQLGWWRGTYGDTIL